MKLHLKLGLLLLAGGLAGCGGRVERLTPAAPVAAAPVCADFSFPIYFDTNVATLGASARAVHRTAPVVRQVEHGLGGGV